MHPPRWRPDNIYQQWRKSTAAETAPTGRYSGQSLQPEELLTQLDRTSQQRGQSQRPTGPRKALGHYKDERIHRGPSVRPELKGQIDRFISCGPSGDNDAEAWQILQSMQREGNANSLRDLGTHRWFGIAYIGFTLRTCRYLVQELHAPVKRQVPKPSELLRLMPTFRIEATSIWAKVLWQVVSGIVEHRVTPPGKVNAEPETLHAPLTELMTLWHMAFTAHLQRQASLTPTLDWSLLPSPETLRDAMRQRADGETRLSFEDALAMLLPPVRHNNTDPTGYMANYEYESAALVTLDVLRNSSNFDVPGYALAAAAEYASFAPFVRLLEGILKSVPTPATRPVLRQKLESREVREQYAPIVERLDLVYSTRAGNSKPRIQQPVESDLGEGREESTARQSHKMSEGGGEEEWTGFVVPQLQGEGEASKTGNAETVEKQSSAHNVIPEVPSDASPAVEATDVLSPSPAPLEPPAKTRDEVTDRFVNLRINRLGHALQKQDGRLAEYIKTEVFDFAFDPAKPQLPAQLYEHLMLTLLSLRNPQAAIEVWNHFVQKSGHQPTAKTYTVMMRGAQHIRDINGMESFWNKMRDAGIQPDIHAWSTRVFGLIKGGKVDAGLKALGDLGQEWVAAARAKQAPGAPRNQRKRQASPLPETPAALTEFEGDVDGVPKPSLIAMNSVIAALASKSDQHIPKVLAWGRRFGLEPDQTTYNVLLNITMRHGQADEAIGILKRMQERGIPTDSTTWTILLSALFEGRSLDSLSPEEQQEYIMNFISTLEAATSTIDAKGYALVIDRLLKFYSNITAANAVLAQMTSRGLQPTAHIYTILMSHYFQRQPTPDFAAADALWRHIQASDAGRGAVLDSVFYDRMIEAYATHHWAIGSTQPLLTFLNHVTATRRRPSWRALYLAAQALAERQDWNQLHRIVDEARQWVKDGDGETVVGERRFGQRDFWGFVIDTGLLRDEGVVKPEDVMRTRTGEGPMDRRMGEMGGFD